VTRPTNRLEWETKFEELRQRAYAAAQAARERALREQIETREAEKRRQERARLREERRLAAERKERNRRRCEARAEAKRAAEQELRREEREWKRRREQAAERRERAKREREARRLRFREALRRARNAREAAQKAAEITGLTAECTLREAARISYFDPRRLFHGDGNLKQIAEMDDDTRAGIASFEIDERKVDGVVVGRTTKIKLWDKIRALEMGMRHLGLYERHLSLQVLLVGAPTNERQ
jgi:hypothetical protein